MIVSARTINHDTKMDDFVVTEWRTDGLNQHDVRVKIGNQVDLCIELSELDKIVKMLTYDKELHQDG